ncbi:MAG: hypothetical protein A3G75_05790 [Verrucomicrobia bacterium RIFCSPLOWO2_12_FULL_64_8]|nr:MAG: hypothetical protein A3G75_05790 [Verrucomicrobia bacterium RIFCSPLOWO2_12_FULL_64_8]
MKTLLSILSLFGIMLAAAVLSPSSPGAGDLLAAASVAAIFALAVADYDRARRPVAMARVTRFPAPAGRRLGRTAGSFRLAA